MSVQESGVPKDDQPDMAEAGAADADEPSAAPEGAAAPGGAGGEGGIGSEAEARLFKRSVTAWTMRLGAVLLIVTAVIGDKAVILGAVFGLCIGLTNFELMARFNAAMLKGAGRGGRAALIGWVLRLVLLFGAAAAVYWKEWNFITAAIGCFLVYPVLMLHGVLGGRRAAVPAADAKG